MAKIMSNPYIVGNPIKTKEMFFGREDDFLYISRKIGLEKANQVIVLCGERRSGKTSVLFQILSGRLGEEFLPVLVDMQILAGIKSDLEFFRAVVETACGSLNLPGMSFGELSAREGDGAEKLFNAFLLAVGRAHPNKVLLFLLDEYELLEAKIKENILTEAVVHFLSGVLEGNRRVSFIFTGSTNLEHRKVDFWKALLGKSIYRKISYLSADDTRRLITEPLAGTVAYPDEVVDAIYRLSGGQPFYVQVVCQNLIDLLIEDERDNPGRTDLDSVVRDIIENPLPQMIYSWNSLSDWTKFALSSLAGTLDSPDTRSDMNGVYRYLKISKIILPFKRERINVFLEEAYQKELLDKDEDNGYAFRMDLYRRWIRKEHSIWKVLKEVNLEVKKKRSWLKFVFSFALVLAAAAVVVVFVVPGGLTLGLGGANGLSGNGPAEAGKINGVTITANQGPFRVSVDGGQTLTNEGRSDVLSVALPPLDPGEHLFTVTNPKSGEKIDVRVTVDSSTASVPVAFTKETAAVAVGAVFISTTPKGGARIFLDGKEAGVTPKLLSGLTVGAHRIEVELDGFQREQRSVRVRETTQNVEIALTAAVGYLLFDTLPPAQVFLDGEHLTDTPVVKLVPVPTGTHKLRFVNESSGLDREITVRVTENATEKIERSMLQ
ncbi:MAG: PEGA domain-containing protein [Spirochaetales bacterium]|nr:PEGA domain-containing protein [Spirochaetales bacterium]